MPCVLGTEAARVHGEQRRGAVQWRLSEEVDDDVSRRGWEPAGRARSLRGDDGVTVAGGGGGKALFTCPRAHGAAYHPGTGCSARIRARGVHPPQAQPRFLCPHAVHLSRRRVPVERNRRLDPLKPGLGQVIGVMGFSGTAAGHYFDMNMCAYADEDMMATAADDNKVKVWSTACELFHPFTSTKRGGNRHFLSFAACWTGVRAFPGYRASDLAIPGRRISLAVDPSGEVVCAGESRLRPHLAFLFPFFSAAFLA